ncbi:MAG: phosphatidylserine/phosphatidylglycerophosphate/cardiolipin synthase-like enzyme [Planctomycetota bacterium]
MKPLTFPLLEQTVKTLACLLILCAPLLPQDSPEQERSPADIAPGQIQLVETAPIETDLGSDDLPETWEVWIDMLEHADETVDLLHFYATTREGSRMEKVIAALFAAADRGVQVRFLLDERFRAEYPETMDRIAMHDGIALRRIAFGELQTLDPNDGNAMRGGVQHAKAMVVDAEDVYIGSANFDWRSMEHIQELGIRARSREIAGAVLACFEADWSDATYGELEEGRSKTPRVSHGPSALTLGFRDGDQISDVRVLAVVSPGGPNDPAGEKAAMHDLTAILRLLEGAQETIRVQLLTYDAEAYGSGYWPELENALRAAASRSVRVELLVADWSKVPGRIDRLKSLQCLPNVEVRLVTIPEWSEGFEPFSRVIHAKYLVVDGRQAWLGTNNWQRGYFYEGRNLGVVVDGAAFSERLSKFFAATWGSAYAETLDPGKEYTRPRVSK